ncbi:MAG: FAD-dependent oxidoreductase [Gaiellaceae bacterium MAG52_C11]|nr:FAD-dependent oxidoreductase [Candidatus Gaiellasilicea maunaloa]
MTVSARKPLLVVADDDPAERRRVTDELARRYGADYTVSGCTNAELMTVLEEARPAGEEVAVVLAAGEPGAELLARVRALHPTARRGLLIPWLGWMDRALAELVLRSMARGWIDLYVLRPTGSPDEVFHRTMAELLQESARLRGEGPAGATIVAEARSARAHALRATISGLGIPHRLRAEPDLFEPTVLLADGTALSDPSAAELTQALGFPTELEPHEADLVVVGAGPAGLSAAVYGSSEGLRTTVLDAGAVGGQAGSSSLIRNYLGFPRGLGGGELAQRAYQQAWLFGTRFRLTQRVVALEPATGGIAVRSADQVEVTARAVVLALGVEYRRLDAPGLAELEGAGVYYGASMSEAQALAGEPVFVVGGGNSAGQAALHLARYAREVTILVRRSSLVATMSRYLIDAIEGAPNVGVRSGTEIAAAAGDGFLERLELRDASGETETVAAAALVILIGAHPRTEWLPEEILRDEWGYLLTGADALDDEHRPEGWSLERPPLPLETSVPGVFAAGDVRARSVKRVAGAVGDGAMAITDVHAFLSQEPAAGWPART